MNPFLVGLLIGWILFIPSVVAGWLIISWVMDTIKHPTIPVDHQ